VLPDADVERARQRFRRRIRVAFAADVGGALAAIPGLASVTPLGAAASGGRGFELMLDGPLGPALAALANLPVASLEVARPSLHELYRELYEQ
jgi:hypothetical protein